MRTCLLAWFLQKTKLIRLNFCHVCLLPQHRNLLKSFTTQGKKPQKDKVPTCFVKNWQLDKGKSDAHL